MITSNDFVVDELKRAISKAFGNPYIPVRIQKNGPATIVFWPDGTKTIVKRGEDEPDSDYAAFTAALGIKVFGSNSKLKKIVSGTVEQKPKVKKMQKVEQAGQNEPQNAEQTEDVALIEKVSARFGMTAEQALIAIKAARKQNEQKAEQPVKADDNSADHEELEKVAERLGMTLDEALRMLKQAQKKG